MHVSVHVGPKGGVQYRLWSSADNYRIVSRFEADPYLTDDERALAIKMLDTRKATAQKEREDAQMWRSLRAGR